MFINIRQHSVPYYRLLFIALFLLMGAAGMGLAALDYFTGVSIISAESEINQEALHATAFIIGLIGLLNASLMTYLLKEKRSPDSERRKSSQSIHFQNRRRTSDRRRT